MPTDCDLGVASVLWAQEISHEPPRELHIHPCLRRYAKEVTRVWPTVCIVEHPEATDEDWWAVVFDHQTRFSDNHNHDVP